MSNNSIYFDSVEEPAGSSSSYYDANSNNSWMMNERIAEDGAEDVLEDENVLPVADVILRTSETQSSGEDDDEDLDLTPVGRLRRKFAHIRPIDGVMLDRINSPDSSLDFPATSTPNEGEFDAGQELEVEGDAGEERPEVEIEEGQERDAVEEVGEMDVVERVEVEEEDRAGRADVQMNGIPDDLAMDMEWNGFDGNAVEIDESDASSGGSSPSGSDSDSDDEDDEAAIQELIMDVLEEVESVEERDKQLNVNIRDRKRGIVDGDDDGELDNGQASKRQRLSDNDDDDSDNSVVIFVPRRSNRIRYPPDRFGYDFEWIKRRQRRRNAGKVANSNPVKRLRPVTPAPAPPPIVVNIPRPAPFHSRNIPILPFAPTPVAVQDVHVPTIDDTADLKRVISELEHHFVTHNFGVLGLDIHSLLNRTLNSVGKVRDTMDHCQLKKFRNAVHRLQSMMGLSTI